MRRAHTDPERDLVSIPERALHHDRPYRRLVLPEDLVTDQALVDAGGDQFHHAAIAKAVGDLSLSSATPVNIALFGPWGSGKSTFFGLLEKRVCQQDSAVKVVRYDAWKYGGQALKRNFIQEIARQLDLNKSDFDRELTLSQEQSRIRLWRWLRYNWPSILGALVTGMLIAAGWVAVHAWLEAGWVRPEQKFWDLIPRRFTEFGLVLAGILTTLLLGPKALESAVVKTTRPAAERDDQFSALFTKLVSRIKRQTDSHRLVFFIDELDRCEPSDVVATLVDLKTFLDEPDCVFIVAADRDVLEHALRQVPQAKPIRDDDPYYSTPGAFIDKIFQHQIALPPLRAHALSSFAHALVSERERGLWHDLQVADPDSRLFDDVVYILVPAHVSSPRRVKVLLNNFATGARIAESRNIDWVARARELALLTVLETEFPSVASVLIRFPDLLSYLRGDKDPTTEPALVSDRLELLNQFNAGEADVKTESVAGRIVRDDMDPGADDLRAKRAKRELARQLHDYLEKLAVIGDLDDPRPDLLYLRVVGYDRGLTDPVLGEMIDMAAERQPDVVVAAFADQSMAIRGLAVELLIRSLASHRGTGQANVLESACRIAALLSYEQIRDVAPLAPEILGQLRRATWRKAAIPGAVFLVSAQEHSATQLTKLMSALDASDLDDVALLVACIPALDWMDDDAAESVQLKVAEALDVSTEPLTTALSNLALPSAERLWEAVKSSVDGHFKIAADDPVGLFDSISTAILTSADPAPLLWRAIVQAMNTKNAALVERIYERRDEFVSTLDNESKALMALYQIEIGDAAHRDDWLPHLVESTPPQTEQMSSWARDAAQVIVKEVPTSTESVENTFNPIVDLISKAEDLASVFDLVIEELANMGWGVAADANGVRWQNMQALADRTAGGSEGQARYAEALASALKQSIELELPTMTAAAVPELLLNDWRSRIRELSKGQAAQVDRFLADLAAPTPAADVERLRLRIDARICAQSRALPSGLLLGVKSGPNASLMAGEWLALRPTVEHVVKVHTAIPIGTGPLATYAATLTAQSRTRLWIALEADHASRLHLEAVGQFGVTGDAIIHMRNAILNQAKQSQRNLAAERLMTAAFVEEPSSAGKARGEDRGHKQASALAVALVDTKVNDNIILAGRIILHSGGAGHGAVGKLRAAFTRFANGESSRSFRREQAVALQKLGLLEPRKKGRMRWLYDKAADALEAVLP